MAPFLVQCFIFEKCFCIHDFRVVFSFAFLNVFSTTEKRKPYMHPTFNAGNAIRFLAKLSRQAGLADSSPAVGHKKLQLAFCANEHLSPQSLLPHLSVWQVSI
jgi:hypothetical protein